MVSFLNKCLIKYNFYISFCAVALVFYFSLVTNQTLNNLYYLFTFFGTLCFYNFYRHYAFIKNYKKRYKSLKAEIIYYSLIISCLVFYFIDTDNKYLYFVPFLLTLAYKFPFLKGLNFRDFALLKILCIALVWVIIAIIPFYKLNHTGNYKLIFVALSQLFFFIAITIPFDIFDMQRDNIDTIPKKYSVKTALLISASALFIYLTVNLLVESSYYEKTAHFIIFVISLASVYHYKKFKSKTSQYYFIDGLIILQTLITFIFIKWI